MSPGYCENKGREPVVLPSSQFKQKGEGASTKFSHLEALIHPRLHLLLKAAKKSALAKRGPTFRTGDPGLAQKGSASSELPVQLVSRSLRLTLDLSLGQQEAAHPSWRLIASVQKRRSCESMNGSSLKIQLGSSLVERHLPAERVITFRYNSET